MNTSNDITPRDPAATEPASAAPDDQALADIMTTSRAEPVETSLVPATRRPLGWLIGAGAVVVVGALIAMFSTMSPPPSAISGEPSATTPSSSETPGSDARLLKVTIFPSDGASQPPMRVEGYFQLSAGERLSYNLGTNSISITNGTTVLASCDFPDSNGSTPVVPSTDANGTVTNVVTPVTLTFKVNDDGTLTCVGP